MVTITSGDLFLANTHALCCTINCRGVMGRGIALEFKERYPEMFKAYQAACKTGKVRTGKIWIWETQSLLYPNKGWSVPRFIFNFPTKDDWRNPSKLEWIAAGLDDLKERVIMMEVESIALPALGCANGGLRFEDVRALIEEKLNDLEIPVILYEPQ